MVAILAHIKIKPDHVDQFEAIERELAADTHRNEKSCLMYECFRAEAPNKYYVLLAFRDEASFFEHQTSEWHERHTKALYECFDDVRLEFIDPFAGGGLPLTLQQEHFVPDSELARKYREEFPIKVQQWWQARRTAASKT